MKRTTRVLTSVKPDDLLWCYLGGHATEARNFVQRGPNTAEPNRSPAYRAYCKDCHRSRNGATPAPRNKSAGHKGRRRAVLRRDPEVEHALGVLRDARGRSKGNPGFVYLIADGEGYKVGFSTKPEARVAELQTGNPRILRLLAYFQGTEAEEAALHAKYAADNLVLEWFRPSKALLREFTNHPRVKIAVKGALLFA